MFKNVKYVLLSLIVATIFAVTFFMFKPNDSDTNKLVVGMMSGWAPFMTVNQSGKFEGFDVDVAQKIAAKLGKKLAIKDFGSLSTLLVAMQQKKVAFVLSGLDITQNRLEAMNMVPYTGLAVKSFYLLFWNEIPSGISSIDDLQNLQNPIVCAEPGSAQAKYLDQFKFINQKSLSKIEDMILDIKYGKSLAMIVEPQVSDRFIRKNPELKKLELPIPTSFQTFGMGIAFTKNSPLLNTVKQIVQSIRQDGSLQALEKKWDLEIREQK
jgi:ABC-type amino acid transport substrate-binding protein